MSDIIQQTWDEMGKSVEATGYRIFVRAEPPPKHTEGGIFFAPKESSFYSGPMHLRLVKGTILSLGPKVDGLELGERICFQRKYFVKCYELPGEVIIGCVNLSEVTAIMDPETKMDHVMSVPAGDNSPQYRPV